jgi:predicted DNA-binding transcriptional regulator YafY
MSDDAPLVRQWMLIKILASRRLGATVNELAEELAVSLKTVRRDLAHLRSVGFSLEEATGEYGRKRWRLDAGWKGDLAFTFDEALALYLGRRSLEPLAGTLFYEAPFARFAHRSTRVRWLTSTNWPAGFTRRRSVPRTMPTKPRSSINC